MSRLLFVTDPMLAMAWELALDSRGHTIISGSSRNQVIAAFRYLPEPPELVVLEWRTAGPLAVELVAFIRENERRHTYLLAAVGSGHEANEAMAAGADLAVGRDTLIDMLDAYLMASSRQAELYERIDTLARYSIEERTRLAGEGLEDALTEIPNRRAFDGELAASLAQVERYGETFCLAMIDIDLFKQYNDTYGHIEGDRVLNVVARTMKQTVRAEDKVFRYGGEEFAIILSKQDLASAGLAIERVRDAVEHAGPDGMGLEHRFNGHGVVTISAGVAMLDRGRLDEPGISAGEGWKSRADRALYVAKHAGRNRVVTEDRLPA